MTQPKPATAPELEAMQIQARILAGEKIPPDELWKFITLAQTALVSARPTAPKEKPSDVDFF